MHWQKHAQIAQTLGGAWGSAREPAGTEVLRGVWGISSSDARPLWNVESARQKFCGECGTGLVPEGRTRLPTPESHTPQLLAEKILPSKAGFEGEQKQVAALFAALVGSMGLLAEPSARS
jgi:hypothetical protein